MKYGLLLKEGRIIGEWGGVGEKLAKSLGNNLLSLSYFVFQIVECRKHLKLDLKIMLGGGYQYCIVSKDTAYVYDYNEFEDDEDLAKIDMGQIPIKDLMCILSEYIEYLRLWNKSSSEVKYEKYYKLIWIFTEKNNDLIEKCSQYRSYANVILKIRSNDVTKSLDSIAKIYKIEITNDRLSIFKNGQFENQYTKEFPLNKIDSFFKYWEEDMKKWCND